MGGPEKNKSGSFIIFVSLFRWLNWVLAVVLLYLGATPRISTKLTIAVYGSALAYNIVFSLWARPLEKKLRRRPFLIGLPHWPPCATAPRSHGIKSKSGRTKAVPEAEWADERAPCPGRGRRSHDRHAAC